MSNRDASLDRSQKHEAPSYRPGLGIGVPKDSQGVVIRSPLHRQVD